MKKISILVFAFLCFLLMSTPLFAQETGSWWDFQAVDTMKFSRDLSRERKNDPLFDVVIDEQVKNIAETGATHVAIATPYDEEFVPMLERWVLAARKYKLKVWFRGNWSGWEGWFGYQKISRDEHTQKTREFILQHASLFVDGDIFSSCPECENGGPGDPRFNYDAAGHKAFLISQYKTTKEAFATIGKKVPSNFHSMNGDVARLIMDPETTKALDGIVVIDHYVKTGEQLAQDIKDIAEKSGGKVILGEFGAPVPDIHGNLSESQQAAWLAETMQAIAPLKELSGVSYWVNVGGSTRLWNDNSTSRQGVAVLTEYYKPRLISGSIKSEFKKPLDGVSISTLSKVVHTDSRGNFTIPLLPSDTSVVLHREGFRDQVVTLPKNGRIGTITLEKDQKTFMYKVLLILAQLLQIV